ncbi:MAG: flippase [Stygiobacter sp.]
MSNYKNILIENIISLSAIQILNYLIPFFTLPYLVRILGPEKYGLINFATAFTGYFTILTDYGFNLSATQEISINRNDKQKVSEIFSSIITIKMILFTVSTIIFLIVVYSFYQFKENLILFFITFLSVFGTALFPLWFFMGIEKMRYILNINLSVKIVFTILIFILIKTENDYLKLALLNTITQVLIGLIGFVFVLNKYEISYSIPSLNQIRMQLKNGLNIFLSTISINLYSTSNTFILGLFAPLNVVGYFAAADKIRMAIQGIVSSVSQSIFPYVNKLLNESYELFISFNKKLFLIAFLSGTLISIFLFLFAKPIVEFILGIEYQPSIILLKIMAWLPLIIFLSNVLGIQTMLPMKKHKSFAIILFIAAVINLILSFILVPIYYEIGTVISVLITEVYVTFAFYVFVKFNKIKIV